MTDTVRQAIQPGQHVRCRTATGEWFETVARSVVRVDYENAFRKNKAWPSVAVDVPGRGPVNWPAEAVRVADG